MHILYHSALNVDEEWDSMFVITRQIPPGIALENIKQGLFNQATGATRRDIQCTCFFFCFVFFFRAVLLHTQWLNAWY